MTLKHRNISASVMSRKPEFQKVMLSVMLQNKRIRILLGCYAVLFGVGSLRRFRYSLRVPVLRSQAVQVHCLTLEDETNKLPRKFGN